MCKLEDLHMPGFIEIALIFSCLYFFSMNYSEIWLKCCEDLERNSRRA